MSSIQKGPQYDPEFKQGMLWLYLQLHYNLYS